MRIFYSQKKNLVIVSPFRNGSAFLYHNQNYFELTQINTLMSYTNEVINNMDEYSKTEEYIEVSNILNSTKHKIFIYRNPIERFYSYYENFIFKSGSLAIPENVSTLFSRSNKNKFYTPHGGSSTDQNFIRDLYINFSKIKRLCETDAHIAPQNLFFNFYKQNIIKYKVIDFVSYTNFIKKVFGNELNTFHLQMNHKLSEDNFSLANKPITLFDIQYINEINSELREYYKDDFEKIKPLAELI